MCVVGASSGGAWHLERAAAFSIPDCACRSPGEMYVAEILGTGLPTDVAAALVVSQCRYGLGWV